MRERILRHLLDYGTITTWEAIQEYGCTRLSEYIRQIREEQAVRSVWEEGTNRYGEKVKYVRYVLN